MHSSAPVKLTARVLYSRTVTLLLSPRPKRFSAHPCAPGPLQDAVTWPLQGILGNVVSTWGSRAQLQSGSTPVMMATCTFPRDKDLPTEVTHLDLQSHSHLKAYL
jgi:hypothetical protein